MKAFLKNTMLSALCAFGAFVAMIGGGFLYYAGTAPAAHAGSARPVAPAGGPVPAGDWAALNAENKAFFSCYSKNPNLAARYNEIVPLNDAMFRASNAVGQQNNAEFQREAASARAIIARLRPTFGC